METDSKDPPWGRSRARGLNTSREDPKDRECFHSIKESYNDSFSHAYHDRNRSRHMKRRRDNKSSLSSVSRSDSSDGRVWFDELPPESIDSYKDLKAAFLAYFMQQKKYVKDLVEIHNIKQKDGETIEDFKVETGRMKGAPDCMRIFGFMHGVNKSELTKHLNEHVPKTMEEIMITTTAFIRGEAAAASKKKGHAYWKAHDQSKGKTQIKEILTAEAGKFQPKPPMVTLVEKRSNNKFYDFHNDKGHSTDECMQLKRQIEELVRAGKLSHLIKEIKHRRDQSKTGKKETAAKDKPTTIYMIQSWKKITRQKSQMVPATTLLTGFSGETIWPLGQLRLLVIIGDTNHSTRAWMNFMIVRSLSPYNGIIGRSRIRAIQAMSSTVYGMLKFLVEGGIVTIRSTVLIPTECTSMITSSAVSREERTRPANFKVALHSDFPDQEVAIKGTLSDKRRTELCSVLKKNLDIFAWKPSDMTGVPRSVAKHRLNIREGYSPVRQKKKGQAPERAKAIQTEIRSKQYELKRSKEFFNLHMDVGIMREIYYHDWMSNPVMLAETDEEKTTFHTGQGVYCYMKMPFGLKNVGATYQRLMDKAFKSQVSQNIEVYVNDLVVKSYTEAEMMRDIEETFCTLRKVNMKLNPKRCLFGLAEGMFLGCVVTPEWIKLCPDKTATVLQLPSPRTIKEVQSLNGKLASLNRFLSKSAEKPRTSVKGQILAYFLIEMPGENPQAAPAAETQQESWTLFTDGSSCVDGSGAGLILINPEGIEFTYALRFQFAASNNEAEYEALIAGLWIAVRMGVKDVHTSVDSKLVAKQVLGTYVAKEENMVKYLEIVKSLVSGFTTFSISVGRSTQRQIYKREECGNSDRGGRTDLDDTDSGLFKRNSPRRQEGGKKASPQSLTIRAEYVMREIHEGSCSMHAGPQSVVAKAIRLGYYWPTMHREACDMIQKCNDCQVHRPITRNPRQPLTPITTLWPFYKWGIDIAGPFPEGQGKVKFLIVAMDYFTKWIEAKAVATITGGQFSDNPFNDWCDNLNITQRFASVKHPQSNGLVERANRSLGEGIKSRLGERNRNWVEELPHVLWAHRTMIKSSHGDTPFSLTYGTKAVIPAEIEMPTYRIAAVDVVSNNEELRLNLDLLEEWREHVVIYKAKAKSKMTKYYNARVHGVTFKPGDFVYRSNDASHAVAGGKLGPKWEGPYEVTEALGDGAYKLRSMDETILPRT
nr:reverse transcriptase domain-containing protein [Tanacetum cinerariifolium]